MGEFHPEMKIEAINYWAKVVTKTPPFFTTFKSQK